MTNSIEFSELVGETLLSITVSDEGLFFKTNNGRKFEMYHDFNCCEDVKIESITGDLNDLIGFPVTIAEVAEGETPNDYQFEFEPDSYTWTFYKLATIKGYVDIRWLGLSNGYYSEKVSFIEII